ncbi:hypothetical protein [Streptomyces sp. NBC_00986]|uniref:hypothetical protein n=1 Tax=Streptomyces sp. NBC_00986 TaxID=2903702 RepID=UPI00386AD06D|nr:helicase associated domain-containing protein [Streptomyces sp. NBC_00986]
MLHPTAARQYHARGGHLHVPRKHTETIKLGGAGDNGQETAVRLSVWTDNTAPRRTSWACTGERGLAGFAVVVRGAQLMPVPLRTSATPQGPLVTWSADGSDSRV